MSAVATIPIRRAAVRSKAEDSIAARFEAAEARRAGSEAPWLRTLRREAMARLAAAGLPSRRTEEWKYTDLRARLGELLPPVVPQPGLFSDRTLEAALGRSLLRVPAVTYVFYNGALASWNHGPLMTDAPGFEVTRLARAMETGEPRFRERFAASGVPGDGVSDLNLAFATDGALLRVVEGAKLDVPIHIVYLSDAKEAGSLHTRSLIEIGSGAEVSVLESHAGTGAAARQATHVTRLTAGEGAKVSHLKLLAEPGDATHLGTWSVELGREAQYRALQLSEAPDLARSQLFLTFAGPGAQAEFNAAFLGRGRSHIDTTLVIDHAVPRCTSRELIKGVLDDEARGVFQGKVIVRPNAQKTDGKQMAKALLLSESAEFDSKPELEIYADDVACGHGSTSAEIDRDQLFYLTARGIARNEARALLIDAFVGEVLDGMAHEGLRAAFRERATAWLAAGR